MSNANATTLTSLKGSMTKSYLTRHILRATLSSILVWYTLTYLDDLIRFANDLLAAPPHTRAMVIVLLSLFTFATYMVCITVECLSIVATEMIKQTCRGAPKGRDVQK